MHDYAYDLTSFLRKIAEKNVYSCVWVWDVVIHHLGLSEIVCAPLNLQKNIHRLYKDHDQAVSKLH